MSREWQIFVPGVGQHDNIGDVILRRELIQWLRPFGKLHVYVGAAPDGYAEALGTGDDDEIYYGFGRWYRALLKAAVRRNAAYVFKPGEIQLTLLGMKEHIGMLPALALVRLGGGVVARVGVGSRNFDPIPRALMRPSILLSHLTAWRDTRTAMYMRGRLMPDLAFGQGGSAIDEPQEEPERGLLIVSMRSDRDFVSEEWRAAVTEIAHKYQLEIVTIVQVLRDRERSAVLAEELGGRLHDWDGTSPLLHEETLRELYRGARIVVSDRLHVLIAAVTEGAAPAALLTDDSDKIDRHFAAAGIDGVSLSAGASGSRELTGHLEKQLNRSGQMFKAVDDARLQLAEVRSELAALFDAYGKNDGAEQRVWHVGRSGDVAGGMTQVVNGYIDWNFERTSSHLIVSRDGTRGVRGAFLMAKSIVRLARMKPTSRDVMVVHLSQRGSFIREGLLLSLASVRGFATIAHIHGSEFVQFSERAPRLVRRVLRRADEVIVLSDLTREAIRRLVPDADIRLVPNAVGSGAVMEKGPAVVFGGAVSRRKGVDTLLKAWERVGVSRPDWTLKVLGPVKDEEYRKALVQNVEMPGSVPHAELMTELATAEIAVLPSFDEAMPVFLIEAMANGCAVLSTSVGGIEALLEGGAGLVIEPGDVDQLADSLALLIDDEEFRHETAARGRARYEEHYSMSSLAPVLEETWAAARSTRYGLGSSDTGTPS